MGWSNRAARVSADSGDERGQEPSDLLKVILQGRECRLRAGEVSGLQRLRELAERLVDGVLLGIRSRFVGILRAMMVVMMAMCLRGALLRVLLHRGVVALRTLEVPSLQILPKLMEGWRDWIVRVLGIAQARHVLRDRRVILLRLG